MESKSERTPRFHVSKIYRSHHFSSPPDNPSSSLNFLLTRTDSSCGMADNIYDEIEIEDMTFDSTLQIYHYPCPCGDRFEIGLEDLRERETDIAVCPSCSLQIRIIYEVDDLPQPEENEEDGDVTINTEQQQVPIAVAA
nr:diphthamide biosynthesis protein 3 [Quercus suber]